MYLGVRLAFGVTLFAAGVGLVSGFFSSREDPFAWLYGLAFLAAGATFMFSASWQFLQPRPYLRLEDSGFECPCGGAQWSDVARIGVYRSRGEHGDVTEMLLMSLSPGS